MKQLPNEVGQDHLSASQDLTRFFIEQHEKEEHLKQEIEDIKDQEKQIAEKQEQTIYELNEIIVQKNLIDEKERQLMHNLQDLEKKVRDSLSHPLEKVSEEIQVNEDLLLKEEMNTKKEEYIHPKDNEDNTINKNILSMEDKGMRKMTPLEAKMPPEIPFTNIQPSKEDQRDARMVDNIQEEYYIEGQEKPISSNEFVQQPIKLTQPSSQQAPSSITIAQPVSANEREIPFLAPLFKESEVGVPSTEEVRENELTEQREYYQEARQLPPMTIREQRPTSFQVPFKEPIYNRQSELVFHEENRSSQLPRDSYIPPPFSFAPVSSASPQEVHHMQQEVIKCEPLHEIAEKVEIERQRMTYDETLFKKERMEIEIKKQQMEIKAKRKELEMLEEQRQEEIRKQKQLQMEVERNLELERQKQEEAMRMMVKEEIMSNMLNREMEIMNQQMKFDAMKWQQRAEQQMTEDRGQKNAEISVSKETITKPASIDREKERESKSVLRKVIDFFLPHQVPQHQAKKQEEITPVEQEESHILWPSQQQKIEYNIMWPSIYGIQPKDQTEEDRDSLKVGKLKVNESPTYHWQETSQKAPMMVQESQSAYFEKPTGQDNNIQKQQIQYEEQIMEKIRQTQGEDFALFRDEQVHNKPHPHEAVSIITSSQFCTKETPITFRQPSYQSDFVKEQEEGTLNEPHILQRQSDVQMRQPSIPIQQQQERLMTEYTYTGQDQPLQSQQISTQPKMQQQSENQPRTLDKKELEKLDYEEVYDDKVEGKNIQYRQPLQSQTLQRQTPQQRETAAPPSQQVQNQEVYPQQRASVAYVRGPQQKPFEIESENYQSEYGINQPREYVFEEQQPTTTLMKKRSQTQQIYTQAPAIIQGVSYQPPLQEPPVQRKMTFKEFILGKEPEPQPAMRSRTQLERTPQTPIVEEEAEQRSETTSQQPKDKMKFSEIIWGKETPEYKEQQRIKKMKAEEAAKKRNEMIAQQYTDAQSHVKQLKQMTWKEIFFGKMTDEEKKEYEKKKIFKERVDQVVRESIMSGEYDLPTTIQRVEPMQMTTQQTVGQNVIPTTSVPIVTQPTITSQQVQAQPQIAQSKPQSRSILQDITKIFGCSSKKKGASQVSQSQQQLAPIPIQGGVSHLSDTVEYVPAEELYPSDNVYQEVLVQPIPQNVVREQVIVRQSNLPEEEFKKEPAVILSDSREPFYQNIQNNKINQQRMYDPNEDYYTNQQENPEDYRQYQYVPRQQPYQSSSSRPIGDFEYVQSSSQDYKSSKSSPLIQKNVTYLKRPYQSEQMNQQAPQPVIQQKIETLPLRSIQGKDLSNQSDIAEEDQADLNEYQKQNYYRTQSQKQPQIVYRTSAVGPVSQTMEYRIIERPQDSRQCKIDQQNEKNYYSTIQYY